MFAKRISTLVGALAVAGALVAAPAPAAAHPTLVANSDSVTGCLKKGDKPDSYSVTTQDGKTVWVASQSVSLAGHVGHTVTLTGNTQTESMGAIADSGKMSGMSDSMKMGKSVMQVTKLDMVSASCK